MGWNRLRLDRRGYFLIITEPKDLIGRYVARKCGITTQWGDFQAAASVNSEGEIEAGCIFYGYLWPNIMMNVAAERMTPAFAFAMTSYPFVNLKCRSITGMIKKKNKASRRFAEHLGAELRGVLKEAAADDDVLIYQLMSEKASRWLGSPYAHKCAKELRNGLGRTRQEQFAPACA